MQIKQSLFLLILCFSLLLLVFTFVTTRTLTVYRVKTGEIISLRLSIFSDFSVQKTNMTKLINFWDWDSALPDSFFTLYSGTYYDPTSSPRVGLTYYLPLSENTKYGNIFSENLNNEVPKELYKFLFFDCLPREFAGSNRVLPYLQKYNEICL